jgi:hypothetical protein
MYNLSLYMCSYIYFSFLCFVYIAPYEYI